MGTRCAIFNEQADKAWLGEGVYVHNDGYPEGVGFALEFNLRQKFGNDRDKLWASLSRYSGWRGIMNKDLLAEVGEENALQPIEGVETFYLADVDHMDVEYVYVLTDEGIDILHVKSGEFIYKSWD